jgi:formylglycine-generating enzyme required for sulfatase activity
VQAINVDERTSQPVTIVVEVLDPSLFTTTPTLTPTSTGTPTLTPTPTLTATRLPPTAAATPETVVPTTTITTTATPTPTAEITPQAPTAPSQMVYVPAGKFLMGSNDDHVLQATEWCGCGKDQFVDELYMHEVYVSAFYIDKYEVTNRQFLAFADAAGYVTDAEKKYEANTWRTAFTPGKEDHPVVWMTWNDASAYCQWAGKRLPTEAEWEKAARGDDARLWPWGNEWDNTRLNMKQGMRGTTTKVGSFPGGASPYGAMDMGGNTWEWVNDWHSFTYYQNGVDRDQDPKGPEGGEDRVLRGGAFNNGMHDVRCANRHRGGQMGYAPDHGFRCAKSAN